MKTYNVNRTFITSQNQVVEAKDADEAEEIALLNEENFEDYWNNDEDWDYTITEITGEKTKSKNDDWCGVCGKHLTEREAHSKAIQDTANNACAKCRKTPKKIQKKKYLLSWLDATMDFKGLVKASKGTGIVYSPEQEEDEWGWTDFSAVKRFVAKNDQEAIAFTKEFDFDGRNVEVFSLVREKDKEVIFTEAKI